MARASAKRGRRPRSNARSAQPVAGEPRTRRSQAEIPSPSSRPPKPAAAKPEERRRREEAGPRTRSARSAARGRRCSSCACAPTRSGCSRCSRASSRSASSRFGVGTGVSGASLGDVIRDVFGGGSDTPSIADAQQKVDENPNDTQALLDLATRPAGGRVRPRTRPRRSSSYLELEPNDTAIAAPARRPLRRAGAARRPRSRGADRAVDRRSFAQTAFSFPELERFLGRSRQDRSIGHRARQASVRLQAATERAQELLRRRPQRPSSS